MTQAELEELLRQIAPDNNPGRLELSESTETVEREEPGTFAGAEPVKRKVPVRTLQWIDRGTGQALKVQVNADGTYTKTFQGVDPKAQGAPATTPAQQAAEAGGSKKAPVTGHPGIYAVTTVRTGSDGRSVEETHYENEGGQTVPEPAKPPQPVASTLNTTSPQIGMVMPDGTIKWEANPNYQKPNPTPLNLPPTQKNVVYMNPDGTTTVEKNPNYTPQTKIQQDASGRWIQLTEGDDGNWTVRPVKNDTVIKPAELPVLQARYGELATGLGTVAADLNGRLSRGEITVEERDSAFKAAHEQANVQVAEINSILENSRASWTQQIQQRGQTLGETQSRRAYASDVLGKSVTAASGLAAGGAGAKAGPAFGAMLRIGQQLAAGMGGFRESPEIEAPISVRQAQGIGIPGYPVPSAPASDVMLEPSGPAASSPSGRVDAPSMTADAGASTLPWTGGPTPPAEALPYTGQNANPTLMRSPLLGQMGQQLAPGMAGTSPSFDPMADINGMMAGREDDPYWTAAVRRAAGAIGRGGAGRVYA